MGANVNWRESKQAYYVDINHLGKRSGVPFSVREHGTKPRAERAAEALAVKIRREQKEGKFKLDKVEARITLHQLAEEMLALPGKRKASTMQLYRYNLTKHLYPSKLARMLITTITPHDIKVFLHDLTGLAHSTTRSVLQAVQTVLSSGVERELIARNPADRLSRAVTISDDERAAQLDDLRVLSATQVTTLLDGIGALDGITSIRYALFLLLARTGLRISEALALKWDCVDLNARILTVKRNVSAGQLSTPKSHQKRTVEITSQLAAALEALQRTSGGAPGAFVFPNPRTGNVLPYRTVLDGTWDPVTNTLGLGRITPHILRHSVASQLLAAGKSILYVSELLGHAQAEFTWRVYGHLVPDDTNNTLDVLDVATPAKTQPRRNLLKLTPRGHSVNIKRIKHLPSRKSA